MLPAWAILKALLLVLAGYQWYVVAIGCHNAALAGQRRNGVCLPMFSGIGLG
jgi:hypothetical protein